MSSLSGLFAGNISLVIPLVKKRRQAGSRAKKKLIIKSVRFSALFSISQKTFPPGCKFCTRVEKLDSWYWIAIKIQNSIFLLSLWKIRIKRWQSNLKKIKIASLKCSQWQIYFKLIISCYGYRAHHPLNYIVYCGYHRLNFAGVARAIICLCWTYSSATYFRTSIFSDVFHRTSTDHYFPDYSRLCRSITRNQKIWMNEAGSERK